MAASLLLRLVLAAAISTIITVISASNSARRLILASVSAAIYYINLEFFIYLITLISLLSNNKTTNYIFNDMSPSHLLCHKFIV